MSGYEPEGEATTTAGRSLRGKFLLASASLEDPNFVRTIVLIVRHDADGAMGVVVNRPLGVTLGDACGEQVDAARGVKRPLFLGGPCGGALVAVHDVAELADAEAGLPPAEEGEGEDDEEGQDVGREADREIVPGVWLSTRREALEALMRHAADAESEEDAPAVKFAVGFAAWGSGQIEAELAEDAWQVLDADAGGVFAGSDARHPGPPETTPLPRGAIGLLALLAAQTEGHDPIAALATGVRQWVRLSTYANLSRVVDPKLIPDDPSVN